MSKNFSKEPYCAAATGDRCGEGAVWHAEEEALYWTDINRFLIHRLQIAEASVKTWHFSEPVTALALTERDDTLLAVFGSRVCLWMPKENKIAKEIFRLSEWPAMRFNDARADPRGSLWAGTMTNNVAGDGSHCEVFGTEGILYRIDPDGCHRAWKKNIGISNTLAWSPDKTRFYFGDTLANTIFVYDYNAVTGEIQGEMPFLKDYAFGLPDGSTIDSEGHLWNCRPGAGCVVRIGPDGQVVEVHKLPARNPTTCTFGGKDLSTLYVTSASSEDRLAGCLFAIPTAARGQPENCFHLL